jgi:hypothetical protein
MAAGLDIKSMGDLLAQQHREVSAERLIRITLIDFRGIKAEPDGAGRLYAHEPQSHPAPGTPAALTPADIGAAASRAESAETAKPAKALRDPKAIWADAEVAKEDDSLLLDADREDDGRKRPEYDILYKQSVTSEDMYLGMGDMDPTSSKCDTMVVKIRLPGESIGEVDLDVKRQSIVLRSKQYKLATYLPHKVRNEDGKAQWLKDKEQLVVSLPIIRKELWELED